MKGWAWLAIGVAVVVAGLLAFGAYERHVGALLGRLDAARDSLDHARTTLAQHEQAAADSQRRRALEADSLRRRIASLAAQGRADRRALDSTLAQLPALVPRDTVAAIVGRFDGLLAGRDSAIAAQAALLALATADTASLHGRLRETQNALGVAIAQRDGYRREAQRWHLPSWVSPLAFAGGVVVGALAR